MPELLTIKQAAEFATNHIQKLVTTSNISYLITYGRVAKANESGTTLIDKNELIQYYNNLFGARETAWKQQLGEDLNWSLSFDNLKEADTTKHVHRLHPYKGKFIPQLVEYFLNTQTDEFKTKAFFKPGDVLLDPFCGSGTTLVQANEMGIHAIGVDISAFNAFIANTKIQTVDIFELQVAAQQITQSLRIFLENANHISCDKAVSEYLNRYNNEFFPSPEFKIRARNKSIDEKAYATLHEKVVGETYQQLQAQYKVIPTQPNNSNFLDKWYLAPIRQEINFVYEKIQAISNQSVKNALSLILSRTLRTCRATTHADLATLVEPVIAPYYCAKHGKICKPLASMLEWWERYTKDTVQRFAEFQKLRTPTFQYCLNGNSENIPLEVCLKQDAPELSQLVQQQGIQGIFSSPPYVGLIDYHEQHAYAYDLFGFPRRDAEEIGALSKKQTKKAQQDYINGIANVLKNAVPLLVKDYDIFLVSNDKYNLYPQIAEQAGMCIVQQYKRPVLNRTEKDKQAYAEIIFHLKQK